MNSLLRYLDPVHGPVVSLGTSLQPGLLRPFYWYSVAKLAPSFNERFSFRFELPLYGTGWGATQYESQSKAIVEAVERSAHFQYRSQPNDAGLNIDRSTTGFAAAPSQFGIEFVFKTGLHETLERWVLNRICDGNAIPFKELPASKIPWRLRVLFANSGGKLRLFRTTLRSPSSRFLKASNPEFVLAILELNSGGIVPGSACGIELTPTVEQAVLATFSGFRKLNRILEGKEQLPPKITVQRLWHYRFNKQAAKDILDRIHDWSRVKSEIVSGPDVEFERELIGPWNPEVRIARVLVENSRSIEEGSIESLVV